MEATTQQRLLPVAASAILGFSYLEFEVAARESTLSRNSHWDSQLRAALPRMVDTLDKRLGEQTAAVQSMKAEISKSNTSFGCIEQK